MARITGGGSIGDEGKGSPIHDFSGDVRAERLDVSLDATIEGRLTVNDDVILSNHSIIRQWTSEDTDIDGLVAGSAAGTLYEGHTNGHIVFLIRDNDVSDSFYILSGNGDYMTDQTADLVVFRVSAAGLPFFPAHRTTAAAATCNISVAGELLRSTSSIKYKRDVEPLIDSDWIYRIMPVTFRTFDDDELYMGFIAEDVADNAPAAAITDEKGIVENYDERAIIAALVKEVQQLREEVDQLKAPTGQ